MLTGQPIHQQYTFGQFLLGSAVITGTVLIQMIFIGASIKVLTRCGIWLTSPRDLFKTVVVLMLWMIAGMSLCACLWAYVYLAAGVFERLEPALYFSVVTFTTLGYGDITLGEGWRLMASLTAVNGLIIAGLITAYLVEAISRIRKAQPKTEAHSE